MMGILQNISKYLSVFQNEMILILLCSAVFLTLWVVKLVLFTKFTIIDIALWFGLTFLVVILAPTQLWQKIIIVIIYYAILGYGIYNFIIAYQIYKTLRNKLYEHIKNNDFDFFIQINYKNRVIDCNGAILKLANQPKKEIINLHNWENIFDFFNITSINNKEFSKASFVEFINNINLQKGKHAIYQFEMECHTLNNANSQSLNRYIGLVQPIYYKSQYLGKNIYFYYDRRILLEELKEELENACEDIEDLRNINYVMMSLTDYAVLFYDFTTKTYVATESLCKFANLHKQEYTFNEIVDMIHPDDLEQYIEQSETINSISLTKIKYRLLINGDYYFVMEDSINLKKNNGLVSIIRVIAKEGENNNIPLSTKEADKVIDSLICQHIGNVINRLNNILDTILGDIDEKV